MKLLISTILCVAVALSLFGWLFLVILDRAVDREIERRAEEEGEP
jgi:hypothetical protein